MIKRKNYKILIGILIGILLPSVIAYAVTLYEGNEISYDNSNSTLSSTNVQDAIDELYEKCDASTKCPEGYICLFSNISLGDYVSLTPTSSSYTTSTTYTGYTETQTINPQELNLWRVISINGDGTADIISEHVSSVDVYFSGQTGYKNLVGYLNVLASQYENSNYTTGSRYFGYNGQTEYITSLSTFTCSSSSSSDCTCSTDSTSSCTTAPVESQGGGDTLYTNDYELVNSVLGTLVATNPSGTASAYWIASRYFSWRMSNQSYYYRGRSVNSEGALSEVTLRYRASGSTNDVTVCKTLRPILSLKINIKFTGSGTESDPWVPIAD